MLYKSSTIYRSLLFVRAMLQKLFSCVENEDLITF
ncbi:unnamed protein product [Larinioides sclopetarius]|uniref:Uncharacterized protein n=1 Tax=Larinioides sclopetarius TaxID=280406 RepID=A0AAV1ZXH9_9ARAC